MFTWEIDNAIRCREYIIPSAVYNAICQSPQVTRVRYLPFEDKTEIWTSDGGYWKIKVYQDNIHI